MKLSVVAIALLVSACGTSAGLAPAEFIPTAVEPKKRRRRRTAHQPAAIPLHDRPHRSGYRQPHDLWHPGCPVAIDDLRLVTVSHWTFSGRAVQGTLVVNRDAAGSIVAVMRRLFAVRYPIQRMRPVEAYNADDERSMADNNTSAFNCRRVSGSDAWSEHAYGRAIDINPLRTPRSAAAASRRRRERATATAP